MPGAAVRLNAFTKSANEPHEVCGVPGIRDAIMPLAWARTGRTRSSAPSARSGFWHGGATTRNPCTAKNAAVGGAAGRLNRQSGAAQFFPRLYRTGCDGEKGVYRRARAATQLAVKVWTPRSELRK